MGNNRRQGQLKGPFSVNQELYDLIKQDAAADFETVQHLGIQCEKDNIVIINGTERMIGRTGIYELMNTEISSIYFAQDVDLNTIIDYTIYIEE